MDIHLFLPRTILSDYFSIVFLSVFLKHDPYLITIVSFFLQIIWGPFDFFLPFLLLLRLENIRMGVLQVSDYDIFDFQQVCKSGRKLSLVSIK